MAEKQAERKSKKKPLHRKGAVIGGLLGGFGAIVAAVAGAMILKPVTNPPKSGLGDVSANQAESSGLAPPVSVNQNVSVEQNGASAQAIVDSSSDTRRLQRNVTSRPAVTRDASPPSIAKGGSVAPPAAVPSSLKCADTITTTNQSGNSQAGCNFDIN